MYNNVFSWVIKTRYWSMIYNILLLLIAPVIIIDMFLFYAVKYKYLC